HRQIGPTEIFLSGQRIDAADLASRFGLDPQHLSFDLSFLHSRGLLRLHAGHYRIDTTSQAKKAFQSVQSIPAEMLRDMVEPMVNILSGKSGEGESRKLVADFLRLPKPTKARVHGWIASPDQIEIGYRLVPMVLTLHSLKISAQATEGASLQKLVPNLTPEMKRVLIDSGMIGKKTQVTALGMRVLTRGPGPFGIIYAYTPYMRELLAKLTRKSGAIHVNRAKNIAASQDANRKTFEMANDALDRFSKDLGFRYNVFIEHALGQGEAIRQRFQRVGEQNLRYFGADLEDAAIDRAVEFQRKGI